MSFSKLKNLDIKAEHKLESKDYIVNMSLRNARTLFRVRSHMTDVKMNQKSNKTLCI